MKNLSYLALAATLVLGAVSFADPALAAGGRMSCGGSDVKKELADAKQQLSQMLHLDAKPGNPSIDDWNGCLKVSYTDDSGHNVVDLYDPESLTLVNELN